MEILKPSLIALHVAAGVLSLIAALAASSVKALGLPQRMHVLSGRTFAWAMLGVCATAIPLSLLGGKLLLLLVAVFSGYLTLTGWRQAVRLRHAHAWIDRTAAILMMVVATLMLGWGGLSLRAGASGGVVLLAFGAIGLMLSIADVRCWKRPPEGVERIAQHMIRMMAATIAVVTALVVVNVRFDPGWVPWIAPTVLLTPVIVSWSRAIRSGRAS